MLKKLTNSLTNFLELVLHLFKVDSLWTLSLKFKKKINSVNKKTREEENYKTYQHELVLIHLLLQLLHRSNYYTTLIAIV